MPSHYYDDDWINTEGEFTGGEDTDDDHYDEDDSYVSDYEDATELIEYYPIKQPVWKRVRVGNTNYMVSDMGRIRPEDSLFQVTKGFEDTASPYRTYTFMSQDNVPVTYYMHDIVWQAFNGPPPDGWEVKHTINETCRRKRHYSNSLSKLTIVPSMVNVRPTRIFI